MKFFYIKFFKSLKKVVGSISQRYGSGDPDPDPHQNVKDPQHCMQLLFILRKNYEISLLRYLTQSLTFHRGVLDEEEHIVLREDPGAHPNSLTQPTGIKNMIYSA
jgi:hypothetical protein